MKVGFGSTRRDHPLPGRRGELSPRRNDLFRPWSVTPHEQHRLPTPLCEFAATAGAVTLGPTSVART